MYLKTLTHYIKSLHTIIEVHYVEIESKINFPGVGGWVGGGGWGWVAGETGNKTNSAKLNLSLG